MAKRQWKKGALIGAIVGSISYIIIFTPKIAMSIIPKSLLSFIFGLQLWVLSIFSLLTNWFLRCPTVDWGLFFAPACSQSTYLIGIPIMVNIILTLIGGGIGWLFKK